MSNLWTVLDTETTGLSPKSERLIEFAASRFDASTGEMLADRVHLYVNPGMPVPPQASAIHGIDDAMLAGKPSFKEVAGQIADFVRGAIVVIHNANFDVGFLDMEFKKLKLLEFSKLPAKIICTRRLARALRPQHKASLDNLCDDFGVDRSVRTLHGALIDCALLAQVYPHLARLEQAQNQELARLLPFPLDGELPPDLLTLCNGHFALETLIARLKGEQKRIEQAVDEQRQGVPITERDFEISYSGGGMRTSWQDIVKDHCPNVELAPYQKASKTEMKIKAL